MIYARNTTERQLLFIPKEITGEGELALSVRNTITLAEYDLGKVEDDGLSGLYYRIKTGLPEGMDDGEYEYSLTQSGTPVGTGILKIGEGGESTEEYNSEIEYEQYTNE
jgi:hypothetical protein